MNVTSDNEQQTAQTAADLAHTIKSGDIILLRGNLGMGKSTFARSLIRTLTGTPDLEVPSPTFTLIQTYETHIGTLWHFDFYRLKEAEEIYELGWEDALNGGIILAEWPERLGALLPSSYLDIAFSSIDNKPDSRMIQIKKVG